MNISYFVHDLIINGGFSVNGDNNPPRYGFMVSTRGHEWSISAHELSVQDLYAFVSLYVCCHKHLLKQYNYYIGGWHDSEHDKYYLDVSINVSSYRRAMRLARHNKQLAIWDVTNAREIRL